MSKHKIAVQFASIHNLWAFKIELKLEAFGVNATDLTIIFEAPIEEIGWAIEKHRGQLARVREITSNGPSAFSRPSPVVYTIAEQQSLW